MSEPTLHPTPTRPLKPLAQAVALWLVAGLASFAVVAFGMSRLNQQLPVSSPVPASLSQAAAGAAAGKYPAPQFRLASLAGEDIGPADFQGQVVVIDLWATWCGPCRIQAQFLETLHTEYQDQGVQFLAINSGEDVPTIQRFVERTPFSYPVLLDPTESVMRRYGANGLPTMMVINVQGQVSFLKVGVADVATLRREIEKARHGAVGQQTI